MTADTKTLLKFTCPSDWDGQPMAEDGFIGLRSLAFNLTNWEAHTELGAINIPDGGQLIIRRNGRRIFIER